MIAGPQASLDATDDRVADGPDELAALLVPILADGRSHTIEGLAENVRESTARVIAALDILRSSGMPLVGDDRSVMADAFLPLDAAALQRALPGWHVDVPGTIDSTNSALLRHVRAAGLAQPMLLASELQRAGRGRSGRTWSSAPGASLTMSCALFVDRPMAALAGVTLLCGLAMRDALGVHGVTAALKWPNDLIVDDRKLAGILVEVHATDRGAVLVIGAGLNVSRRMGDAPSTGLPPTDLAACGARSPDRHRVAVDIARALARRLADFERDGFAPFAREWNAADAFHDRPVTLRTASDAALAGVARGVDEGGALLLDVDGRRTRVVNGDLSLRPRAR
jgi:BirA family biotin operon repressor/biotin-[acetyl-CoA-carboxylase] ligase